MKELNIHAIPTDDVRVGNIIIRDKDNKVGIVFSTSLEQGAITDSFKGETPHHIYLTDDSPIKEENWCIEGWKVAKYNYQQYRHYPDFDVRKIVATTDPKLFATKGTPCNMMLIHEEDLPKIADALNKGVTSVGCEMDYNTICSDLGGCVGSPSDGTYCPSEGTGCIMEENDSYPKTKDGCIVLDWGEVDEYKCGCGGIDSGVCPHCGLEEEKMYTKEELKKAFDAGFGISGEGWNGEHGALDIPNNKGVQEEFNEWIKDNL